MRLSKQTSDAVKILVCCACTDDRLIKVAEIAERTGVTKALGLKLVNLLSRLEYLETVRGPKGGIRLSCVPAETRLGDIVRDLEIFEMTGGDHRDASAADVMSGDTLPPALEGCVDDAFEAFVTVLNQNSLADLATSARPVATAQAPAPAKKTRGRKPTRSTASAAREGF